MEIKEITSEEIPANLEQDRDGQSGDLNYKFFHLPEISFSKNLLGNFMKWGLKETLTIRKFRFNIAYKDLDRRRFLQEFLASDEFKAAFPHAIDTKQSPEIELEKLKMTYVNLDFFDILQEEGSKIFLEKFLNKN